MNERIKELMPKPWTFPYPDRELYTKEQFEKFAELIVKECVRVGDKVFRADHSVVPIFPATAIKEHFGIKE